MCLNYASAEPMLPASIGPAQARFWHMHSMLAMSRFTVTYFRTYPVIIVSFDYDIFDNHLHIQLMILATTWLNSLLILDALRVILSSITDVKNE